MRLSEVRVPRRLTLIAVPALTLALLLTGAVLATLGTRPTVRVTVEARPAETTVPLTVVPPDTAQAGDLPGFIREATVEVEGNVPASGTAEVPGRAHGTVRIENHWSQMQPLAATTRLLSSGGVLFRTATRVDVPSGGTVEVTVEADQSGAAGNIGPDRFTIVALWTGLQEQIFGTSHEPMTGGGATATVVAEEDLVAAQTAARAAASTAAQPALERDPPGGTELAAESLTVVAERTLDRSEVGEVTETAQVKLRATVRGLMVATEAYTAALSAAVGREYPGETVTALSASPDLTGVPLPGGPFPVAVALKLVPGSAALSARRIAGRTSEEAAQLLRRILGVTDVRITGLPFWARTLPAAGRIRVTIDTPGP